MYRSSPQAILTVVCFGVFVAADDLTVVSTMLRQIIFDLRIPLPDGLNDAAWIVNAYLIAYVVVMPLAGRLSDLWGRRAVYLGAFSLFLVGSVWLPLAHDLPTFIVGRVLTALGGGAMVPVGMAVIGDVYETRRRPGALGVLGAVDTAGWVWGPLYGALLIRYLHWRWQFYLNVPLALIGMAAAWYVLRDWPRPAGRERLDGWGAIALTAGLLALNLALLRGSDIQSVGGLTELTDDRSADVWPLYLAAVASLSLFVWIERRLAFPLVDLRLFRRPNFTPAVLVNFLVGSVLIIAMINVPLLVNVLEVAVERAALVSGWLLSALTGAMAALAYVGGRLTGRWSYRPVTIVGLAACAAGFALMGQWPPTGLPYSQMAWQLALLGMGFGLVIAPVGAAVINAAPETQRGVAASLVIVLRLMGMSVGLAGLTAWGLHRFQLLRTQLTLPPLTDPGFADAFAEGLTRVTVTVLTETFWVSAGIAAVAIFVALWLRPESS